jgi:hypothetical protein
MMTAGTLLGFLAVLAVYIEMPVTGVVLGAGGILRDLARGLRPLRLAGWPLVTQSSMWPAGTLWKR